MSELLAHPTARLALPLVIALGFAYLMLAVADYRTRWK